MLLQRRTDLPLDRDPLSRFLPWLIAFMVFLAVLAFAGAAALAALAERWDTGVRDTLTVQVPPADQPAAEQRALDEVLGVLASTPGIARYAALDEAKVKDLLEPWLGAASETGGLPLPTLVEVDLDPDAEIDARELERRLRAKVQGTSVDDHRVWLDRLLTLIRSAELIAGAILVFVVAATVATVVFTTRTGLAIHKEAIEVLHLIGARDSYIARQFANRALMLGLRGGLIGLVLGLPTLLGLGYLAGRMEAMLMPGFAFGVVHWTVLALLPAAVAGIAMLTAHVTVLRQLKRLL